MDCPYEWKCRTERYDRYGSGVTIRDALIGFGLGYTMIPISCGTETANSYADTIWCSGTFDRWCSSVGSRLIPLRQTNAP